MEDSCYITRTLPTKMRLPNTSSVSGEPQLSSTSTLPAPWASSRSSYQKPVQSQHHQHQQLQHHQQQQQLALHHHHHQQQSNPTKGYRSVNGVASNSAQKITPEPQSHPYPPPRPFSQTMPHTKFHFSPVQNVTPTYHQQPHHHQPYHPPSTVYSQSKVASVQPTHLYNRSYASPMRSSPPPQPSVATIKQVQMVTGASSQNNIKNIIKNGTRTPSPPPSGRQPNFHPNNDVTLRRTTGGGSGPNNTTSSTSSSRRNAILFQSANAKASNPGPPYFQQQQQQQSKPPQKHSNDVANRNYHSKSGENNVRNAPVGVPHRSLSPQEIIINYEDSPSRSSPVPQATNKNSKPPLPPPQVEGLCPATASGGPRPPPRTRPKSWTSSLFNVIKNNHSSVTFQCVVEEQSVISAGSSVGQLDKADQHKPKDASELAMPLTAASASDGQKFYSLPRPGNDAAQNKVVSAKTRSRTPSPFRTIIKGLVKGKTASKICLRKRFCLFIWDYVTS